MDESIASVNPKITVKNVVKVLWVVLFCSISRLKSSQTTTQSMQAIQAHQSPVTLNFFDELPDLEPDWLSGQSLFTKSPPLTTADDWLRTSPSIETVNVTQFDMAYIATPSLSRQNSATNKQPCAEQLLEPQHTVPETTIELPTPSPLSQKPMKKKRKIIKRKPRTRSSYSSAVVSSATLQATQKKKKSTNSSRKRANTHVSQESTDYETFSTPTTKRQRHKKSQEPTTRAQEAVASTAIVAPPTPKTQQNTQPLVSPRSAPLLSPAHATTIPITPPTTFLAPPLIPVSYVPVQAQSILQASSVAPTQPTAMILTDIPAVAQATPPDTMLNIDTPIPEENPTQTAETTMISLATLIAAAVQPVESDTVPEEQPTKTREEAARPYCCLICCTNYTDEATLYQHQLIHKIHPFYCTICQYAFARKKDFDKHALSEIHTKHMIERTMAVAKAIHTIREQSSSDPFASLFACRKANSFDIMS